MGISDMNPDSMDGCPNLTETNIAYLFRIPTDTEKMILKMQMSTERNVVIKLKHMEIISLLATAEVTPGYKVDISAGG